MLLEQRREVALVAEAGAFADLADCVFARQQKFGRAVQAIDAKQVVGRNAGQCLDFAVEVRAREAELFSEKIDVQLAVVEALVDVGIELFEEFLVERGEFFGGNLLFAFGSLGR